MSNIKFDDDADLGLRVTSCAILVSSASPRALTLASHAPKRDESPSTSTAASVVDGAGGGIATPLAGGESGMLITVGAG